MHSEGSRSLSQFKLYHVGMNMMVGKLCNYVIPALRGKRQKEAESQSLVTDGFKVAGSSHRRSNTAEGMHCSRQSICMLNP